MHYSSFAIIALASALVIKAEQDLCPKDEYACLDIINSSQCLAQIVLQKTAPLTKENLVKCIDYEGVASTLPPAQKV